MPLPACVGSLRLPGHWEELWKGRGSTKTNVVAPTKLRMPVRPLLGLCLRFTNRPPACLPTAFVVPDLDAAFEAATLFRDTAWLIYWALSPHVRTCCSAAVYYIDLNLGLTLQAG